mmetsp:Transcript_27738/g.72823  ORF Transcript_27738/g.72823 Transcript_27738/m.72823 type:complete len:108 (+) Transcript_27738:267-590(+)
MLKTVLIEEEKDGDKAPPKATRAQPLQGRCRNHPGTSRLWHRLGRLYRSTGLAESDTCTVDVQRCTARVDHYKMCTVESQGDSAASQAERVSTIPAKLELTRLSHGT